MNDGVLTNLILLIMIILVSTGWFQSIVSEIGKGKVIFIFLAIFILSMIELPFNYQWKVNMGGFIVPMVFYFYFWIKGDKADKPYLFAATTLLGAIYFLFKELIRLDPILMLWNEQIEITFFLVMIVLFVSNKLVVRLALLIGGLLLGEIFYSFHHRTHFPQIILGNALQRDILWLSLIQLYFFQHLMILVKNWVKDKQLIKYLRIR
ncbi:YphA family membrane protein [Tepidibacillus decaturensis]|uniref:Uncharacterized protein n=1 Tax=Tepidibacillus decaturensis TaxID=1413211 RepID=A0A135L422_9BACI|nr:hypothetical protein [Tepidibacillus decaturensis]KXG43649.1 hypothetical protein U473_06180 [Tepidibacillus decaturensis]